MVSAFSNEEKKFHHLFIDLKRRFPFDSKTPIGFTIAIIIQFALISYGAMIGACFMNLQIGSFLYTVAMAKCLKSSLLSINKKAHCKARQALIPPQMIESLQFHSRLKQLSRIGHCGHFLFRQSAILHLPYF